jgi:lipopolysaccharide export system protein LptA
VKPSVRRRLRQALGLLTFAGFPLAIVLSWRPAGARTDSAPAEVAETLLAESEGIRDRVRFEEFDYSETEGDSEIYRLRAAEAIAFADGADRTFRLKDVTFLTRDAESGRAALLEAPRAEFVPSTKAFRVFEGVRVEGAGIHLAGHSFRYDPPTRLLVSDGPVTAIRGSLVARALGGAVESGAGIVRFRDDVRLGGEDDRGRRISLTADAVDLERGGGLSARGDVVLKTDELVLRGREVERRTAGDGDLVTARGNVEALLVRGAGGELDSPIRTSGEHLELERNAEAEPTRLGLSGAPARIDLPPAAGTGARRAVAEHFEARLADGRLDRVQVPAPFRLEESAPPAVPGSSRLPASRRLEAGRGQLAFGSDGRTLETAVLEGGVLLSEGERTRVTAPSATLRAEDESAVFAGSGSEKARYEDESSKVAADVLTWFRREQRIEGAGGVKTSFRGREGSEVLGGGSSAPVFSESDFLRVRPEERTILLTGNVTAWQEENVLRGQSILLDDRDRSLRAEGEVRAVLRRRRVDPKTKTATVETITASGSVLTHREADRLLRIEGSANVVSGTWTMKADVTDVVLGPERTVDHAESRGNVVVEDRADGRRGEGAKATWDPRADAVALEGRPATALDGKGNRMTGARLRFQRGSGRVDVETGPGIPSQGVLRPEGT